MRAVRRLVRKVIEEVPDRDRAGSLSALVSEAARELEAASCTVFLGERGDSFHLAAGAGDRAPLAPPRLDGARRIVERALDEGPLLLTTREAIDGGPTPSVEWLEPPLLVLPLVAFGDVHGALLVSGVGVAIGPDDLADLRPLANVAALISPRHPVDGLWRLAEICVRLLEEKDAYTHGHSLRVARVATLIGEELDLAPDEREELRLAALLHDLGKVIVKDSILRKQGDLEDPEWEVVRIHPVVGANIARKINRRVARGIHSHHERVDGRGYPEGLEGDAIPLYGRIVAVADAFDAITSIRPYRSQRTMEEAVAEIRRNAGTQFDGPVTEALRRLHDRGDLAGLPAVGDRPPAPAGRA